MKTNVETRLLEAGIHLFSQYGFHGVRQQDLVRAADTTLPSFYQYHDDPKAVFDVALDTVIARSLDLGKLAMMILSEKKDRRDSLALAHLVARRWYDALTLPAARLLMYAGLSQNKKWKRRVDEYLGGIISLLASTLREEEWGNGSEFKPEVAASGLIWALFYFKVNNSETHTPKEEEEAVSDLLNHWLLSLPGKAR